jgi:hypothetical protein
MNDLDLVRQLDDTPDPGASVLKSARERLMAGIAAGASAPSDWADVTPASARMPRRRRQLLWGAAVAAAAAILAVGLVESSGPSSPSSASGPSRASGPSSAGAAATRPAASSPTSPTQSSGTSPTGSTTAPPDERDPAVFLHSAALAATALQSLVPAPGQFLYATDGTYEAWLSVDGTQDGEVVSGSAHVVPGCHDGAQQVPGNYTGTRSQPCAPRPAYLADAPTTAQAMAAYITDLADPKPKDGSPRPAPTINMIGKEILSIQEFNYLLPAAQAALYQALPLLGLDIALSPATLGGASAVAVSWALGDSSTALYFDPATYAYLGCATTAPPRAGAPGPTGTAPSTGTAAASAAAPPPAPAPGIFRKAIVDAVGQRP